MKLWSQGFRMKDHRLIQKEKHQAFLVISAFASVLTDPMLP